MPSQSSLAVARTRGAFRKAGRRCQGPGCREPLTGTVRQQYHSKACKQRAHYRRNHAAELAKAALARAATREHRRLAAAQWRADNPDRINASRRAKRAAQVIQRALERPNCVICGKRLTDKQRQRGVTCGPYHSTLRWRWFVKREDAA